MADYESDSSVEETGSFVTTSVLLGYASKETTDDEISQLGGEPSWLHSQPPAPHLTTCSVCNERMPLLLQLHADLPERFAGHERRLHIFGCRRKTCRRKAGSVRALRSTRVDPSASSTAASASAPIAEPTPAQPAVTQPKPNLGSAIFGGGGPSTGASKNPFALAGASGGPPNPFSLGSAASLASKPAQRPAGEAPPSSTSTSTSASTLPSTFAEKAKISSSPSSSSSTFPIVASKPAAPPKPPGPQQAAYPSFFLDADYEALGADGPPDASAAAAARVQVLDGDEPGTSGSSGDKAGDFESAHDKTFQRFADRLWHNPEQVLRYEFAGTPLLYSRSDAVGMALGGGDGGKAGTATGIPRCANCGARRVFECQLAPHAIVELEADDEVVDGMEWGTVIVAVCERDCETGVERGKVGYREEWAGVQWEESKK